MKIEKKNIIIALLVVFIFILIGVIVYDHLILLNNQNSSIEEVQTDTGLDNKLNESNSNKNNNEKNTTSVNDISLEKENDLMDKINVFDWFTYQNAKVESSKIRNELKISYAISKELKYKENIKELSTPSSSLSDKNKLSLNWKVVKARADSMFGSGDDLELVSKVSVSVAGIGCYNADFNCTSDSFDDCNYTLDPYGCDAGWGFTYYKTKEVKREEKSTNVIIYQNVLILECNPVTSSCDVKTYIYNKNAKNGVKEKTLGTIANRDDSIEEYFSSASTYKYTFKEKNGDYYFVSSEIEQ